MGTYSRTEDQREQDNARIERALRGELVPAFDKAIHCKVAGVASANRDGRDRQQLIAELRQFDEVDLCRERNEHDVNAVRVHLMTGACDQIGWLPREIAAEVARDIDAGGNWRALVTRVGGFPSKGVGLMLFRLCVN